MRLAAVVVLYNPENNVLDNIKSYYQVVEKIYVIDNSENENTGIASELKKLPKIKYLSNKGNKGIAFALNRGAANALHDKFFWLLTMDQDTSFSPDSIKLLIEGLDELSDDNKLAIIAANYREPYCKDRISARYSDRKVVIQSGSIINLKIFRKLNGYENRLFIDEVDFDYCFRCKQQEYKIIRVNRAMMHHNRGNLKKDGNDYTWNYPPIRYYYIVRNRIYIWKKYKKVLKEMYGSSKYVQLSTMIKMVWKEDEKYKKLLGIILGSIDSICGRMGKCRWKILG